MRAGAAADRHDEPEPHRQHAAGARAARTLSSLLVLGVALACAPPPRTQALVPAAIAARGGPLPSFERESELRVHYGFPGSWRWVLGLELPHHLRLTLQTTAEDQTFVSDGAHLRTYLGNALVGERPIRDPCGTALWRWVAIVNLDALLSPPFAWRELEAAALPPGVARAAQVRCTARPEEIYTLHFDAALRLVRAKGPVEIPVLGSGRLEARFSDFQRTDGRRLPASIAYRLDGQRFLEERVVRFGAFSAAAPGRRAAPPGSADRSSDR